MRRGMPSDAVTITAAVAAPTVAGVVAVVIHRQRLAHERRQTDLAYVRELLAHGAERALTLERAVKPWLPFPGPTPTVEAEQALERAANEWRAYLAALQVVFADDTALVTTTRVVDELATWLARAVPHPDPDRLPPLGEVARDAHDGIGRWREAAREVAGAKL